MRFECSGWIDWNSSIEKNSQPFSFSWIWISWAINMNEDLTTKWCGFNYGANTGCGRISLIRPLTEHLMVFKEFCSRNKWIIRPKAIQYVYDFIAWIEANGKQRASDLVRHSTEIRPFLCFRQMIFLFVQGIAVCIPHTKQ